MKRALIVVLAMTAACIQRTTGRPQIGPAGPGEGGRDMPPAMTTTTRTGLSSKKVNGKEEPNVLLAADRTRCIVSAEKFRETSIGESVLCGWGQ
jgi:hypothetical protein